jgi:hypothetical protein
MNKKRSRTKVEKIAGFIALTALLTAAVLTICLAPLSAREQNQTAGQAGVAAEQQQVRANPTAGSHLHVALRITEDGAAEVIKATELPGEPIIAEAMTGNFIYEVADDRETLAVETMTDPFELRSFPPPDAPDQGHSFGRAQSAMIIIKVPKKTLESADLDRLAVRLYKIKPDAQVETINLSGFRRLKENDQLEQRFEIADQQLGAEIRLKGRKLGTQ